MNKQEIKDLVDSFLPQVKATTRQSISINLDGYVKDKEKKQELINDMHDIVNRAVLSNDILEKSYRSAEKWHDMVTHASTEGVEAGLESGMTRDDAKRMLVSALLAKLNDEARESADMLLKAHAKAVKAGNEKELMKHKLLSLCMQFSTNLHTLVCCKIVEEVFGIDLSDNIILSESHSKHDEGRVEVKAQMAKFGDDGELILGEEVDIKRAKSVKDIIGDELQRNREEEEEDFDKKVWN